MKNKIEEALPQIQVYRWQGTSQVSHLKTYVGRLLNSITLELCLDEALNQEVMLLTWASLEGIEAIISQPSAEERQTLLFIYHSYAYRCTLKRLVCSS